MRRGNGTVGISLRSTHFRKHGENGGARVRLPELFEQIHGLVQAILCEQCLSKDNSGFNVVGMCTENTADALLRLFNTLMFEKDPGGAHLEVIASRIDTSYASEALFRQLIVAVTKVDLTEKTQRIGILGLGIDDIV